MRSQRSTRPARRRTRPRTRSPSSSRAPPTRTTRARRTRAPATTFASSPVRPTARVQALDQEAERRSRPSPACTATRPSPASGRTALRPAPTRTAATPATPASRASSTTPTSRRTRSTSSTSSATRSASPSSRRRALPTKCGYQTGPQVPAKGGGSTTDPRNFAECAGLLGDRQPGINYARQSDGLFGNLPRYDNSVCPDGSTVPQICDENISTHTAAGLQGATPAPRRRRSRSRRRSRPQQQKQIQKILNGVDPNKIPDDAKKKLQDLLPGVNLPDLPQLPDLGQLPQSLGLGGASGSSSPAAPRPRTSSTSSSANDDHDLPYPHIETRSTTMNGRARVGSLAASPTMVGAITTLIVIVAVFLAYNANNGLPFVPTYQVSAEICDAARLGPNNEVRIGGNRVGVVESIDTVQAPAEQRLPDGRRLERLHGRQAQPEAGQERRPAARRLHHPGPLPVLVRPQVPRDRSRHQRDRPARGRHAAARPVQPAGRVRRRLQHLRHRDAREQPARPAGLRRRVRRARRLAERGDRRPQPAVRQPEARLRRARGPGHPARPLLPGARRRRPHRRAGRRGQRRAVHQRRDRVRRHLLRPAGPARHDLRRPARSRGRHPVAARPAAVPGGLRRVLAPAAARSPRPARRAAGAQPDGPARLEGPAADRPDEQGPQAT